MVPRIVPNRGREIHYAYLSHSIFKSTPNIKVLVGRFDDWRAIMVGAQGFEPRPAGIFWSATKCFCVRLVAGFHRSVFQLIITIFRPLPIIIPVQLEPAILPGYTILPCSFTVQLHCLACRRARLRRRSFFLRHFHRWLPVFFHALEPRFMVNSPPTDLCYMRTSQSEGVCRQAKIPFW